MNIKRAKNEIKDTIEAYLLKDEFGEYVIPQIRQRPVLLLGAPGIGKTQIMEQIAHECRIGLVAYTITHHTRQSAIGLPFLSKMEFDGQEYTVTEYTMSEIVASIYKKMEVTGLREGILFIDEINCVSETLAPAMLQFLQCKTFGSHEIPQGWIIVAAGNPPEYNKSVREFDVVTMDRVKKIEVEPDYAVWKEYALKEQLHSAVISYLDTRPGSFYKMETTVDGRKFVTPRGWEDLSTMLRVYESLGKEMDREVVVQYIQHEMIAKDFANYLELYQKYRMDYQLDRVLNGQIDEVLLKKAAHAPFDERLAVVSLLLSRCREAIAAYLREEEVNALLYEQLKILKEDIFTDSESDSADMEGTPADPEKMSSAIARKSAAATKYPADEAGDSANGVPEAARKNVGRTRAYRAHACLTDQIAQVYEEYEQKKTAGLLSRVEDRQYRQVAETLESYYQCLKTSELREPEDAFAWMKGQFDRAQDALDASFEEAGSLLEHAFDFIEAAFGSGQEMVVFITNLNTDEFCVRFLRQYDCERYYQYNKELLFEEKSRSIEARLAELDI
ncbi:MAG: AAA family ATPase [Lachnospiraceae bacterium]|nr:AAA family ATPase [Lachnospiraceae bacterium]